MSPLSWLRPPARQTAPKMADQPKLGTSTRAAPPSLNGAPRKPTPSPLQVSQISTPIIETLVHMSPNSIDSHQSPRAGVGTSPFTPRSPHYSPVFLPDRGDSPNDGDLALSQPRNAMQDSLQPDVSDRRKNSPLATPRGNEAQAARNPSATSRSGSIKSDSPPHSSLEIQVAKARVVDHRPVERLGPRTSSIDSTVSSMSSTTTYSHASADPLSPNPAEIAQMVAAAGSSDALIRQLAKEKKQHAAQNAQLWRLINKQRTLVIGLNADLARAIEDKEKYQRRYKELSASVRPQAAPRVEQVRKTSPSGTSSSPAPSDDELPIQRHSVLDIGGQRPLAPAQGDPLELEGELAAASRTRTVLNTAHASSQVSSSTTSPSFSSESMPKASPESEASDAENDDDGDSRRNTIMQSHFKPVAPLEIHKKMPPTIESFSQPRTPPAQDLDMGPSPSSFSARRSIVTPRNVNNSPRIGGDSPVEPQIMTSPNLRKGPPAPLNLQQRPIQSPQPLKSPEQYGPEDHSESEYDEAIEDTALETEALAPVFERGRKMTREEDDREREFIMKKEVESRSQSKKEKRSKSGSKSGPKSPASKHSVSSPTQSLPKSPAIRAFSPNESPTSLQEHLSPHASLAGVLSGPASSANSIVEQSVTIGSSPPLSPGLPRSPRPVDRPLNSPAPRAPLEPSVASPPLSPRPATLSPPALSPRAPRHPIPVLPHTPTSLTSPPHIPAEEDRAASTRSRSPALQPPLSPPESQQPPKSPRSPAKALSPRSPKSPIKGTAAPLAPVSSNSSTENISGGIYRGLVSEAYPDLLLAPNALPLILIKVTSSRLRPSRHSMLSMKSVEEEPVFTLGITARSNMKQLWRVEKPILSLPQLDHQLKQLHPFEFKLPDRSLFAGHAPAKIDARREALERYFEDLLDTEMDDRAGLVLCHFLSTQVVPVEDFEVSRSGNANQLHLGPDGRIIKEGFLTKRGKNFGGWKARYFVLDEPILRYYESPGGALLGTIKLMNAQIGRQAAHHNSHSPSRGGDEHDKEFRHAFLLLEPKKKDSSSVVRHVLCAENDVERDAWVEALFQYIGKPAPEKSKTGSKGILSSMMRSGKDESPASTERGHDEPGSLQGVSYEDTVAGQPVKVGPAKDTMSPMATSFGSSHGMMPPPPKTISGPTNGSVIQDAVAWGNQAPESPKVKEREKKRGFWGFRDKQHENASNAPSSTPQPAAPKSYRPNALGRQVFGMPLAEAVEMFPVRDTDLALPAVVYRCLEYLETKDAANEEGIFRLSGSNVVIKQLRERFNTEGDVDLLSEPTPYDVHAVASLLKAYLRELPNTVLGSRDMHLQFLQVLGTLLSFVSLSLH